MCVSKIPISFSPHKKNNGVVFDGFLCFSAQVKMPKKPKYLDFSAFIGAFGFARLVPYEPRFVYAAKASCSAFLSCFFSKKCRILPGAPRRRWLR
jgi:hypothetical protein